MTRTTRYEAIADHLRQLVDDGEPGDRLPSEAELSVQFEVSRMTARHAVQIVETEGNIERRRGAGTFILSQPVTRDLGSPLSFSENMRSRGMTPSSETLSFQSVSPTPDEVEALHIESGEEVFALERLRRADGTPMAIERAVLRSDLAEELHAPASSASLHESFMAAGRVPTTAHAEVTARRATSRERDLLELPSTGIVIVERRTIFDQNDRPLERTVTWYAAGRYSFQAVLVRGVRPPQP